MNGKAFPNPGIFCHLSPAQLAEGKSCTMQFHIRLFRRSLCGRGNQQIEKNVGSGLPGWGEEEAEALALASILLIFRMDLSGEKRASEFLLFCHVSKKGILTNILKGSISSDSQGSHIHSNTPWP